MAIVVYPRWPSAAILDFIESEIAPFDPPFPKTLAIEPNMEWIGCTVCEIFAFKLYCDLETGFRGYSRSSKVTPFDSLHMVSYYCPIVTLCLLSKMHRFRDMTTYWSKIAEKTYPTLIWHVPLGWPLAIFSTTHILPETRIMGLSDCVHFTILLSLC